MEYLLKKHEMNKNVLRLNNGRMPKSVFYEFCKNRSLFFHRELSQWLLFVLQCVEDCISLGIQVCEFKPDDLEILYRSPEKLVKMSYPNKITELENQNKFIAENNYIYQREIRNRFYPLNGKMPQYLFDWIKYSRNKITREEFLDWFIPVMEFTLYACNYRTDVIQYSHYPIRLNAMLQANHLEEVEDFLV